MLQTGLGLVPGYQLVRDWLQLQRRGEAACRRQERGCIKSRPRHRQPRPSRDQREAGDGVTTAAAAAATAQHQQVSSGPGSDGGGPLCVSAPPRPRPAPSDCPHTEHLLSTKLSRARHQVLSSTRALLHSVHSDLVVLLQH